MWRNWQTRGTQNPVRGNSSVGSIPSTGILSRSREARVKFIEILPGVFINLDQIEMIDILSDKILFHGVNGKMHELLKKNLPDQEWEKIKKQIEGKIVG